MSWTQSSSSTWRKWHSLSTFSPFLFLSFSLSFSQHEKKRNKQKNCAKHPLPSMIERRKKFDLISLFQSCSLSMENNTQLSFEIVILFFPEFRKKSFWDWIEEERDGEKECIHLSLRQWSNVSQIKRRDQLTSTTNLWCQWKTFWLLFYVYLNWKCSKPSKRHHKPGRVKSEQSSSRGLWALFHSWALLEGSIAVLRRILFVVFRVSFSQGKVQLMQNSSKFLFWLFYTYSDSSFDADHEYHL